MPSCSHRLAPLALAAAVLGGCQDYNFSPVKYCLIQPGTERVTLSAISTADILFVVDDSGSMGGKQQKLKDSFDAFVGVLQTSNVDRVSHLLEPIDFHIAVTTTSVFLNAPTTATCLASCAGSSGQPVCCDSVSNQPQRIPKGCSNDPECATGNTCRTDCQGRSGEKTCCAAALAVPELISQTCPTVGQPCGRLTDRYVVPRAARLCNGTTSCALGPDPAAPNPAPPGYSCQTTCIGLGGTSACCNAAGVPWRDDTCVLGVGTEGGLYPKGDFVRSGANPRVLHFTKEVFCPPAAPPATGCAGPPDTAAINTLIAQFKQNVNVGTCGSGQEQGMEAARRSIQKALHLNGLSQPADVLPAEWPHEKSKLVVVFVGDEDDCSSPEDPNKGVIFSISGTDACLLDYQEADPAKKRQFKLAEYADFLTSLGRPVAAAFIVSATSETCEDDACQAGLCCDTACTGNVNVCSTLTCGGVGAGYRFIGLPGVPGLSGLLQAKGADTVVGSVCNPGDGGNPGFSSILKRVAEVVKQPTGLQLPTQPASAKFTVMRIAGANGKTRKTCYGPAPAGTTQAQAEAAVPPYDWWFTGGDDTDRTATSPTRFVYINLAPHTCEANPGETYSADYLGLLPAGGCTPPASALDQTGRLECQAAFGGQLLALGDERDDWTCYAEPGAARGTCLCGSY